MGEPIGFQLNQSIDYSQYRNAMKIVVSYAQMFIFHVAFVKQGQYSYVFNVNNFSIRDATNIVSLTAKGSPYTLLSTKLTIQGLKCITRRCLQYSRQIVRNKLRNWST